jgi:hypothetical protein
MTTVSTAAALAAALKACGAAACLITVAPGARIDPFVLSNWTGQATIASQSAASPGVFGQVRMTRVTGLTFEHLVFDASRVPVGPFGVKGSWAWVCSTCSSLTFADDTFGGSPTGTLASDVSGLSIAYGTNVSVTGSTFDHLHNALAVSGATHVTLGTRSLIRDDAIEAAGDSDVTVTDVKCRNQHPDGPIADTDHPDCVQFWTTPALPVAQAITITGVDYARGTIGTPADCIWVYNPGTAPTFQGLAITASRCVGAQQAGVGVYGVAGAVISGNTVCAVPPMGSLIYARNSVGVRIAGNQVSAPPANIGSSGLTISGNRAIAACTAADALGQP